MPDPTPKGTIFFNCLEAVKAEIAKILTPVVLPKCKIVQQIVFDPDIDNWVNELLDEDDKVNALQIGIQQSVRDRTVQAHQLVRLIRQ
jgi:hypothetical protein